MNMRGGSVTRIRKARFLAAGLLLLAAGCGKKPPPPAITPPPPKEDPASPEMAYLISYQRTMRQPGAKHVLLPTCQTMVSRSWKKLKGEGAGPLAGAVGPGRTFGGVVLDAEMRRHVTMLQSRGLDKLVSRATEDLKPDDLRKDAADPQWADLTRLIAVGTPQGMRTYAFRDQPPGSEAAGLFQQCETLVSRIVEGVAPARTPPPPAAPEKK